VDCGSVHLARVTVRKELKIGDDEKMEYLKQVDFTSKRLWFLYELDRKGGCGCAGNAEFFSGQSILVDEELALFSHKVSISTF